MKTYIANIIENVKWMLILLLVVAIVLSPALIWVFTSSMEARAYNRVTGSDVSTWNAMWVTLRVDGKSN